MMKKENHEGLPHLISLAPDSPLPPGDLPCVCCGEWVEHPRVQAWDCDLEGFVCVDCVIPLAGAEFELVQANRVKLGIRRPELDEFGGLGN